MNRELVNQFLEQYQFGVRHIDMQKEMGLFLLSMEEGLQGGPEGMEMIPTWLGPPNDLPTGEKVIVMDMGGSNVRVAVAGFNQEGEVKLSHFQKYEMPGSNSPCTKEEFLESMVEFLRPVLGESDRVGICFSYEVEILPNHDGRILRFTKEVEVPEMEGELLGESLRAALDERGLDSDIKVVVLNDTVAALLGGAAARGDRVFDNYIGIIMGTGMNAAYVEAVERIAKLEQGFYCDTMIINMEAGGYSIVNRSSIDQKLDEASNMPGYHKFEKMISGRYQGPTGHALIAAAATEGLFSKTFTERFESCESLSSRDLDKFLYRPFGANLLAELCESDADREVLTILISAIFERAACLVALAIGGILTRMDAGRSSIRPCLITIEGTTYDKSKLFKDMLVAYMHSFVQESLGRYYEFVQVENSNLIGTALATVANSK